MNKGFSLVELIVVIAIMAILVGVAVPVYTNYISQADAAVDKQYGDELKRAVDTLVIDIKADLTDKYDAIDLDKEGADIAKVTWTSAGVQVCNATGTALTDDNARAFLAAIDELIDIDNKKPGSDYTIEIPVD